MRSLLIAALAGGVLLGIAGPDTRAAPPAQTNHDLSTALLTIDDLPDDWSQTDGWDWQRFPIPDEAGNLTSLGIATSAEPRPSPTLLGRNSAGVEFTTQNHDGYAGRYIDHAVIAVPAGEGPAKLAMLRAAMRTGTLRTLEPEGSTNVMEFTAMPPPAAGDEAHALHVAMWDEVPGRETPRMKADGVLYAIRRGDHIAILIHLDVADPGATRDVALTDKLTSLVDQRLATLAGVTVSPTDGGGDNAMTWVMVGLVALALVAAVAAVLVIGRNRGRPHAADPA